MKVALMGRSLRGRFSGVVRYTDDLIRALAPRLNGDLSVFLSSAHDGLDDLTLHRIRAPFPTPTEYARAFWEQSVVPITVSKLRPDVYHSPNYILPLALSCPTVVTIHDLAFLDRAVHRLRSHLYLSLLTGLALEKATRVISVSRHTAAELAKRFPHVAHKTRVVGEAVNPRFAPQPPEVVERFRCRHGLDEPYVLFVGTIEPRKNLPRLIRAFEAAVAGSGAPHHLVMAGGWGWKAAPVWEAFEASRVRDRLHYLQYLPEAELPAAYCGADLFAYPSLSEGFGLPPLEAMACGTAVLTSNVTSLPEVTGGAALTVDPYSVEEIGRALALLMTSPARRRHLVRLGLARAAQLSWEAVASETLQVYREAAG